MMRRLFLVAWVLVVIALTVPWADFRSHAHWNRVVWIPFQAGSVRLLDFAGNVVLYVPLGWWFAIAGQERTMRRAVHAAVTALLLSGLCEWSQVYSHGRFPSATDIAANTIGALLGVLSVTRRRPPLS